MTVTEKVSAKEVYEAVKAGQQFVWDWRDVPRLRDSVGRLFLDAKLAAGKSLHELRPGMYECDGVIYPASVVDADREYVHTFSTYQPDAP